MLRKSFFLLFLLIPVFCVAQKEATYWYFGNNAGLKFDIDGSMPTPLLDGNLKTLEGCAVISDVRGRLLFYTDGIKVWDRRHKLMPNGIKLNGHPSSTQSGVIVPAPGDSRKFYIFTVDMEGRENGLGYSTVDLNENGGYGDVVQKNYQLNWPVTEKIVAVKHFNNTDYWVIAHRFRTNEFVAYRVTKDGVSHSPVKSSVGSEHKGQPNRTMGYMKASPGGERLAVAVRWENFVEVFDFDNKNGKVSNPVKLDCYAPYGLSFSPDDSKLYVGEMDIGNIYQFEVNQPGWKIASTKTLVGKSSSNMIGALQLGIDGRLYVARFESQYLGVINHPSEKGQAADYVDNGISLGRESKLGLPTFIDNYFTPLDASFTFEKQCFGEEMQFKDLSYTIPETWKWDFGDGSTSTEQNPTHQFKEPGKYKVNLNVTYGRQTDEITKTVEVHALPDIELGEDTIVFRGDTVELDAGGPHKAIEWSTGETSQKIKVFETGTYEVEAENRHGCKFSDKRKVVVKELPEIELGEDVILCAGEEAVLNAGGGFYVYEWSTGASTSKIKVNESGKYWIKAARNAIWITDSIQVHVVERPEFDLIKELTVDFGNTDTIAVKEKFASYKWSTGAATPKITVSKEGVYRVTVTNKHGCSSEKEAKVNVYYPPNYLASVKIDEKWGYIDENGDIKIEPQFDAAMPFSEDLAAVKVGKKWGFIDYKGNMVIDPRFENVGTFKEGLAAVNNWNKWGFIDKKGDYIIAPAYSFAMDFSGGLARIRKEKGVHELWGYIDKKGKYVVEPRYPQIFDLPNFMEDYAVVRVSNKWGVIDKKGKLVVDPIYDDARGFSEGLAAMKKGDKWGFIDYDGNVIIPFQFDLVRYFKEGVAAVRKKEVKQFGADSTTFEYRWAYIDKQGNFVIPYAFRRAYDFREGLAMVQLNEKCGLINKSGEFVVKPKYELGFLKSPKEGLVPYGVKAVFGTDTFASYTDYRWGFMDKRGRTVIQPKFWWAMDFEDGLAPIEVDSAWGYIDRSGKFIVPPIYTDIKYLPLFEENLKYGASFDVNTYKWGYIDKSGKTVIPPIYDKASVFVRIREDLKHASKDL